VLRNCRHKQAFLSRLFVGYNEMQFSAWTCPPSKANASNARSTLTLGRFHKELRRTADHLVHVAVQSGLIPAPLSSRKSPRREYDRPICADQLRRKDH
jgi:hypothetical protein